jgi:hypothetical protein
VSHDWFREIQALSFRTPLSLPEILTRLNAEGTRRWGKRDNDAIGEYIGSGFHDERGKLSIRVFFEEDRCIVDILYRMVPAPSVEQGWKELCAYVQGVLLPLLEASDIQETDTYTS